MKIQFLFNAQKIVDIPLITIVTEFTENKDENCQDMLQIRHYFR